MAQNILKKRIRVSKWKKPNPNVYYDPDLVCRICLKDVSVCQNIFKPTKYNENVFGSRKKITYCDMMTALFSHSVSQGDGMPTKLCKICRAKLILAYNLKSLAERSYNTLKRSLKHKYKESSVKKETINKKSTNGDEMADEKVEIKNENDFSVDTEIKQEYMEVVFDVLGSNKDEGVDDHLEDDRSLGYEDEDDTPLNQLQSDSENENQDIEAEKEKSNEKQDTEAETQKKKEKKKTVKKISRSIDNRAKKKATDVDSENGKDDSDDEEQINEKAKNTGEKVKKKRPPGKNKSSVCEVCGIWANSIRQHAQIHDEHRKTYPCDFCPKIFTSITGRRRHRIQIHLGHREYCELCNKTIRIKSSHMLSCHAEKAFKCEVCGRGYPTQAKLNYHVLSHTREPTACDICGKMFKSKGACNEHRKFVHNKEKKHACNLCAESFGTLNLLKHHLRKHTGGKLHKCTQCDKAFVRGSGLNRHMAVHAELKPDDDK